MINNRPITRISDSPHDINPLTPNHLLLLQEVNTGFSGQFTKVDTYTKRWRHAQYLADCFWKRWINDYIPNLMVRSKWLEVKENLKVGDVVLILDESTPRGCWPMAKITNVHVGRDGLVRSVELKSGKRQLVRPLTKLCLLESSAMHE